MTTKRDPENQKTSPLEKEIAKIVKQNQTALAEKDIKKIVKEVMPDIDEMISKKVKEHFKAIATHIINSL